MQRLWPALLTTRDDLKAALFPQSRIIALAHVTEVAPYDEIISRGKDAARWALKSTGKRSSGLCWRTLLMLVLDATPVVIRRPLRVPGVTVLNTSQASFIRALEHAFDGLTGDHRVGFTDHDVRFIEL